MTSAIDKRDEVLRQQESLRSVIESISSELELRPLLTRIVFHACELLGAENGTIGLVDPIRNVVRTEAAYRMPESELGAEMGPGVGLAGEVLASGKPLVLQRYGDVAQPTQPGLTVNSVIGLPIIWRDRMIGFFGLGSPPPRVFDDRDVEVLSVFAKHAAIAIENARLFDRTQRALSNARLLYETSRRISTSMNVEDVVAAYLNQVAAGGVYACSIALYDWDEAGQKTAVRVLGRWSPNAGYDDAVKVFPYTRDELDEILDSGESVRIANINEDVRVSEPLREMQMRENRPAIALIPLMVRGVRIGLVILSSDVIHEWGEEEVWPFLATAAQLAVSLDSRRQHLLVEEQERKLVIVEERQRLARDLHDSVTQLLFSMNLIAQSLRPALDRGADEARPRIDRLVDLSHSALSEMRALLAELRPAQVVPPFQADEKPSISLVESIRQYARKVVPATLNVEVASSGSLETNSRLETVLLRIAQEALNNVVKHARASHVSISLQLTSNTQSLVIKDNGQGFDTSKTGGGMGLATMRERAEEMGGSLRIESVPGTGTTITLVCRKAGT